MTDDAIVGWRYKYLGGKWTNQKTKPTHLHFGGDAELEPMYSAAEIFRLRANLDAARATAQRALGAANEANARLQDVRSAVASGGGAGGFEVGAYPSVYNDPRRDAPLTPTEHEGDEAMTFPHGYAVRPAPTRTQYHTGDDEMSDMPERKRLPIDPMPRHDLRVPPFATDAPMSPAEAMARCPDVAALVLNMQAFAAASKRAGDPPDELDRLLAPFTAQEPKP